MSKNSAFRGFQYPKSRRGSTTSTNSNLGMGGGRGGGGGRSSGTTFSSHMHNSTSGKRRQSPFGYEPPPDPPSSIFASMFPSWTEEAVNFLTVCLDPEPSSRPTCNSLLRMSYFTHDNFPIKFLSELSTKLQLEGRPPLTTNTVRRRRSLVGNNVLGGANVSPGNAGGNVNPTGPRNQGTSGSTEEVHKQSKPQAFQSNNLANQTQFSASTNLSRQQTFVIKEKSNYFGGKPEGAQHSRIPIALTRKSSEEALNLKGGGIGGGEEILPISHQLTTMNAKDKRFSVSQTPKKFSFSGIPQGAGNPGDDLGSLKQEPTPHPLPVTTLTFNIGPHNMSYNGSTYTTSTVPQPVRAKSPSFSSINGFGLGNQHLRRSSPGRIKKKVSLGGGGGMNLGSNNHPSSHTHNPRSLPMGVSVLGSSVSMPKGNNNAGTWSTSTTDHFLPRMNPKNGISLPPPGGIDENNPNPFPNFGNGNALGKKREKMEPIQNFQQSRRSSITTDLGNIKPFLITAHQQQDREMTSPFKTTTTASNLPFM